LCAIQGHLDLSDDASPLGQARKLALLYQQLVIDTHHGLEISTQVGTAIADIDARICGQLPRPRPGVPRGTDSIGGVIARVAEAWACANWALHECDDPLQWHRAWDHLAEIHQAYEDLTQLIMDRRIILPKSWPGIIWSHGSRAGDSSPFRTHKGA
jgi:hypothetical protein